MASNRRAQRLREGENSWRFMVRIGDGEVLLDMLWRYPFVADQGDNIHNDDDLRSHFDFAERESFGSWGSESGIGSVDYSSSTPSSRSESGSYESSGLKSGKAIDSGESPISVAYKVEDRANSLADDGMPDWDDDD